MPPSPRVDPTSAAAGRPLSSKSPPIRVLVVDDSSCVRQALSELLERDGRMLVVGQAANGAQALEQVKALRPDVVTMDFQMPDMDGIEATRQIMEECPTPIVMVSAVLNPHEAATLFMALDAGALTLLDKPRLGEQGYEAAVAHLVDTVQLMSEVRVVRRVRRVTRSPQPQPQPAKCNAPLTLPGEAPQYEVLCIGASTGGPQALEQVLSKLDPAFPLPVLVVQHIATGFLEGLVAWLNHTCPLPVRIAQHGQPLQPQTVCFAPDKRHMVISRSLTIALDDTEPEENVKPAVNKLFRSCASVFGKRAIGVLLTGMGRDGALGLRDMKLCGAMTIAQDQASSIVFGMPGQAVQLGAARQVLALSDIAPCLNMMVTGR